MAHIYKKPMAVFLLSTILLCALVFQLGYSVLWSTNKWLFLSTVDVPSKLSKPQPYNNLTKPFTKFSFNAKLNLKLNFVSTWLKLHYCSIPKNMCSFGRLVFCFAHNSIHYPFIRGHDSKLAASGWLFENCTHELQHMDPFSDMVSCKNHSLASFAFFALHTA